GLCGRRRPARRSGLALPRISPRRRPPGGRRRRRHAGRVTLRTMPTKKQRRRQQKSRRHDYEYVYVDDEGNEVAVDPTELRAEKDNGKVETRGRSATTKKTPARAGGRVIEPPSWRRAVKRAAIWAPLLVLERNEAARAPLGGLAAGLDAHRSVDDGAERALLHLMVAEPLARLEHDQDRARTGIGTQHHRRTAPARRLDLAQVPAL